MHLARLTLLAFSAAFIPSAAFAQTTTASGLRYTVLREGSGFRPLADDIATFHYKGALASGKVFDNSYDRGEPLSGTVKDMIPGMAEGLQLMKGGSKYKLYIPAKLGYGSAGGGGGIIPPNAGLVFDIELISVKTAVRKAPQLTRAAVRSEYETRQASPGLRDVAAAETAPEITSEAIDAEYEARQKDPSLREVAAAPGAEDLKTIVQRGRASIKSGDYAAALRDGEAAVAMAPQNVDARSLRGMARNRMKAYAGALEDFNVVIAALGDKAGGIFFGRGRAYEALQRYAEALADYEKAVSLKPSAPEPAAARDRVAAKLPGVQTAGQPFRKEPKKSEPEQAAAATARDDNRPFMKAVTKLNADLHAIMDRDYGTFGKINQLSDAKKRLTVGMAELEAFNDPVWPVYKAAYTTTMEKLSVHVK